MHIAFTIVMIILLALIALFVYLLICNRRNIKKIFIFFFVISFFSIIGFKTSNFFVNGMNDNGTEKEKILSEYLLEFEPDVISADVQIKSEKALLKVNVVLKADVNNLDIEGIVDLIVDNLEGIDRKNITIINQDGETIFPNIKE